MGNKAKDERQSRVRALTSTRARLRRAGRAPPLPRPSARPPVGGRGGRARLRQEQDCDRSVPRRAKPRAGIPIRCPTSYDVIRALPGCRQSAGDHLVHVFCGASGTSRRHDQTHDLLIWHAQPMGTVTAHTSFPLRHSMPRRMVSPPRLELRDRRSPFGVWSTSGHVNVRGSSSRWDALEAGRGAATCAASRFRRRADSLQSPATVVLKKKIFRVSKQDR